MLKDLLSVQLIALLCNSKSCLCRRLLRPSLGPVRLQLGAAGRFLVP